MGSKETEIRIKTSKSKIGGASKKGRQHIVHQEKYRKQADRTSKNKIKAWTSHLRNHPKDVVAKENIKRITGTGGKLI
mgnify:CR=1 FL=1